MSWNTLWAAVNHTENLTQEQLAQLERFCSQNPWSPEESQQLSQQIFNSLKSYKGHRLLEVLSAVSAAVEPGTLLLDYFAYFLGFITSSTDLKAIGDTKVIVSNAFKLHVPPGSNFEKKLTSACTKFLDVYIDETRSRWERLEQIHHKESKMDISVNLHPAHIPVLEFVIFSFGMSKPMIFYELLNALAMDPLARLHTFSLLKSFLILEESPTYYLIDSELHRTVMKAGLFDTDDGIFLTALSILTIMLPIVAVKAGEDLDILLGIMKNSFQWEKTFELLMNEKEKIRSASEIDKLLFAYNIQAVKRSVEQFFTVLYGMFPSNVYSMLTKFVASQKPTADNIRVSNFVKAPDSLYQVREKLLKSIQPAKLMEAYKMRIQVELLANHRFEFSAILADKMAEHEHPWFQNLESSEIMARCISKKIDNNLEFEIDRKKLLNIQSVNDVILETNRFLYGPMYQENILVNPTESIGNEMDPVVVLKIFYIILINESFFKECMCQYHVMNLRARKKQELSDSRDLSRYGMLEATLKKTKDELEISKNALNNEILLNSKLMEKSASESNDHVKAIKDLENQLNQLNIRLENHIHESIASKLYTDGLQKRLDESAQRIRELEIISAKYYEHKQKSILLESAETFETIENPQPILPTCPAKLESENIILHQQLKSLQVEKVSVVENFQRELLVAETKLKAANDTISMQIEQLKLQQEKYDTSVKLNRLLRAQLLKNEGSAIGF